MSIDFECTMCGKKYPHMNLTIRHITWEHLDGEAKFDQVMQWILVRAHGPVEEE